MLQTPSIGRLGTRRHLQWLRSRISRYSSQSAILPVTGVM
ncbi:UNVERIFIED_CONTAM: hypothetical protein GTU68_058610 [Idotea baltica]|nr:hypothetical protein [Idotea baltica]